MDSKNKRKRRLNNNNFIVGINRVWRRRRKVSRETETCRAEVLSPFLPWALAKVSDLLVSGRTDVYPQRIAAGLELVGDGHVVAEQTVSGHFHADHTGQYRSGV